MSSGFCTYRVLHCMTHYLSVSVVSNHMGFRVIQVQIGWFLLLPIFLVSNAVSYCNGFQIVPKVWLSFLFSVWCKLWKCKAACPPVFTYSTLEVIQSIKTVPPET